MLSLGRGADVAVYPLQCQRHCASGEFVPVESLGLTLTLKQVYEGVQSGA